VEIITKTRFEKDIKKLEKVLSLILSGGMLDDKYKNHPLVGNWRPCWELHLEPGWLLIYYLDKDINTLTLYRTGTQSGLF